MCILGAGWIQPWNTHPQKLAQSLLLSFPLMYPAGLLHTSGVPWVTESLFPPGFIWISTMPASEGRLPAGGAREFISENGPVFTLNLLSGYTASEQTAGKWVESAECLIPTELSTPHGFSYLVYSQLQEVRMPIPISQVKTLTLRAERCFVQSDTEVCSWGWLGGCVFWLPGS